MDGRWNDVENVCTPLGTSKVFDSQNVLFQIRRQYYLELLVSRLRNPGGNDNGNNNNGLDTSLSTSMNFSPSMNQTTTTGTTTIMQLVQVLRSVETVAPSTIAFNSLAYCLTLSNINEHPDYNDWTPFLGRIRTWNSIKSEFQKIFPSFVPLNNSLARQNQLSSEQLLRLLAYAGGAQAISRFASDPRLLSSSLPTILSFDVCKPGINGIHMEVPGNAIPNGNYNRQAFVAGNARGGNYAAMITGGANATSLTEAVQKLISTNTGTRLKPLDHPLPLPYHHQLIIPSQGNSNFGSSVVSQSLRQSILGNGNNTASNSPNTIRANMALSGSIAAQNMYNEVFNNNNNKSMGNNSSANFMVNTTGESKLDEANFENRLTNVYNNLTNNGTNTVTNEEMAAVKDVLRKSMLRTNSPSRNSVTMNNNNGNSSIPSSPTRTQGVPQNSTKLQPAANDNWETASVMSRSTTASRRGVAWEVPMMGNQVATTPHEHYGNNTNARTSRWDQAVPPVRQQQEQQSQGGASSSHNRLQQHQHGTHDQNMLNSPGPLASIAQEYASPMHINHKGYNNDDRLYEEADAAYNRHNTSNPNINNNESKTDPYNRSAPPRSPPMNKDTNRNTVDDIPTVFRNNNNNQNKGPRPVSSSFQSYDQVTPGLVPTLQASTLNTNNQFTSSTSSLHISALSHSTANISHNQSAFSSNTRSSSPLNNSISNHTPYGTSTADGQHITAMLAGTVGGVRGSMKATAAISHAPGHFARNFPHADEIMSSNVTTTGTSMIRMRKESPPPSSSSRSLGGFVDVSSVTPSPVVQITPNTSIPVSSNPSIEALSPNRYARHSTTNIPAVTIPSVITGPANRINRAHHPSNEIPAINADAIPSHLITIPAHSSMSSSSQLRISSTSMSTPIIPTNNNPPIILSATTNNSNDKSLLEVLSPPAITPTPIMSSTTVPASSNTVNFVKEPYVLPTWLSNFITKQNGNPSVALAGYCTPGTSITPTNFMPVPIGIYRDTQPIRVIGFEPKAKDDKSLIIVGTNSKSVKLLAPNDTILNSKNLQNIPKSKVALPELSLVKSYEGHHVGSVYASAWSTLETDDDYIIATGSNDTLVKIIRVSKQSGYNNNSPTIVIPVGVGTIRDVCWIGNNTSGPLYLAVAGSGDFGIRVYSANTIIPPVNNNNNSTLRAPQPLMTLMGHTKTVHALRPWDGESINNNTADDTSGYVVSCSEDGSVRLWDINTGIKPIRTYTLNDNNNPTQLAHPGALLSTNNTGGSIEVHALSLRKGNPREIVCGFNNGFIAIIDLIGGRMVANNQIHQHEIRCVDTLGPFILSSSFDNSICISIVSMDKAPFDSQSGASVSIQILHSRKGTDTDHSDKTLCSKWHPSLPYFVTSSADKTAMLWTIPGLK